VRYGISVQEYEELLDAQAGGCALCGGTHRSGRRLHVDHDHETGRVRGLLCYPCNQAVGRLWPTRSSREVARLREL